LKQEKKRQGIFSARKLKMLNRELRMPYKSESEKDMTRNQQIGAWLALTLLLALALYRWFNLQ
jgi:hypothetical protein